MTSAQGALEGVAPVDGAMIPLHIMALRWKGPTKGPIHFLTSLVQEVSRVVLKGCMKIGILAGEDPQMSPLKEEALKNHLGFSIAGIAGDLLTIPAGLNGKIPGIPG